MFPTYYLTMMSKIKHKYSLNHHKRNEYLIKHEQIQLSNFIAKFLVNNFAITEKELGTDLFNSFFVNIGTTLANKIL